MLPVEIRVLEGGREEGREEECIVLLTRQQQSLF